MRGLPAAAARIEPHMLAMANPTSAPATAAAGLDVLPLQQGVRACDGARPQAEGEQGINS